MHKIQSADLVGGTHFERLLNSLEDDEPIVLYRAGAERVAVILTVAEYERLTGIVERLAEAMRAKAGGS